MATCSNFKRAWWTKSSRVLGSIFQLYTS